MLRRASLLLSFFACFALGGVLPCAAAARPGAPRTLRLSFEGETTPSTPLGIGDAAPFATGGGGYAMLFARVDGGAGNIYRATSFRDPAGKALSWRAVPLTHLGAPNFVISPAPLPDGLSALCIVGSAADNSSRNTAGDFEPSEMGTVSRLDFATGQLKPLVPDTHCFDPAPSPDGTRFAWSAERSGVVSVWVAAYGGERRRIAMRARHPAWLDANTLIYESLRDGRRGIYRVPIGADGQPRDEQRQELWPRGGEVAVSPDGSTLCIASGATTGSGSDDNLSLYVLSSDGSGARAISGTQGARHPHWLPDGSGVVYDAPLPDSDAATALIPARSATRALWMLPMHSIVPVAILLEARPSRTDARVVEIYGTAWCEGDDVPQLRLEVGSGDTPDRWQTLDAAPPPVQQGILGRWTPPTNAAGTWTLRLTVAAASGEQTQNTLPVLLPLVAPLSSEPATGGDLSGAISVISPPSSQPPFSLHPTPQPTASSVVTLPASSGGLPPVLPPPSPGASPISTPTPGPRATMPAPSPRRTPTPRPTPRVARGISNISTMFGDAARVDVVGTPAEMGVGETLEVVATLRNTGRSTWVGSGTNPVRVLIRWTDLTGGYRVRWAVVWPQNTTRPGQKMQIRYAVTAPSRPGRYKITYALLRVPGGTARPPRGTGDDPWPGEFGDAAYAVTVK